MCLIILHNMSPETLILQLPDRAVQAVVKRSAKRRRTLSVCVARDGSVAFNIPLRTSQRALHDFARSKQGWLFAQLQQAHTRAQQRAATANSMQFLGETYSITIEQSPLLRRGGFCELNGNFIIHIPATLLPAKQTAQVQQLLAKWYQTKAVIIFNERIAHFAAQLNVTPGKLKMRDTKSRWGSCDRHGNLNLNWRIVMAPLTLVDYLIVHELCHIVHFDHSPKFWNLVGSILPDYKQRRVQLKKLETSYVDLA